MIDISSVRSVRRRPYRLGNATGFQPKNERQDNWSWYPAMNCLFFRWSLAALFACFTCASGQSAEYCLRPGKEDGTQASNVVCCTTPAGWQGWKDDPHYWDGVKGLNRVLLQGELTSRVFFTQPNCKDRRRCVKLGLITWAGDFGVQVDIKAGLRDFLQQIEQSIDSQPSDVTQISSVNTPNAGSLTIWEFRSSRERNYIGALFTQRNVFVGIYLEAPDTTDIATKLDSLKELAWSVQITDARSASPDIVSINVGLPDSAIREQLLQVTPLGTPEGEAYRFLKSPRFYTAALMPERAGELHNVNGDFWVEIGHYSNPLPTGPRPKYFAPSEQEIRSQISAPTTLPPTTIVKAIWKFDKQRKLRDIEIKREVIEVKPKQRKEKREKGSKRRE
jgi:hypothetical protein